MTREMTLAGMRIWIRFLICLSVAIGVSVARAGAYEDFFVAIRNDNGSALESLLERGMDPNSRDERGNTGLALALREGSFKTAAKLFDHPKIDVDLANAAGETPLMLAALKGQTDWMRRLIDRRARIELSGWSPLHYAAAGPDTAAVALLLDRGARIDARSPNGTTALMMAARNGPESSVDLLLRRGADPRLRNQKALGAADFARMGGRDALTATLAQAAPR